MARKRKRTKSVSLIEFSNVSELTSHVRSKQRADGAGSQSEEQGNVEFRASASLDQAMKYALEGVDVQTVASQVESISDELDEYKSKSQFDTEMDVAGDIPDVGLYLAGEPENMMRFVPAEAAAHVDILVNGAEAGWVDKDTIQSRAAAITTLCELLESNGVYPRLSIVYGIDSGDDNEQHLVKYDIKQYEDTADKGLISGALWPSTLRRIMFKYMESYLPQCTRDGGYGMPMFFNKSKDTFAKKLDMSSYYTIPSITEERDESQYRPSNLPDKVKGWFNDIMSQFE